MSLLQEEREIILSNEYVDTFDFGEVAEFVKNASKDLFISHHFKKKNKMLVHEENIVIHKDGAELITKRAPREIPIIK